MLIIETLRRKTEITKNDERIIDLTTKSFDFSGDVNVYRTVIVSEDFQMRPDLVAKVEYGNSNRLDYICKFNGISNPFSLDMGQVLMIGDADELTNQMTQNQNTTDNPRKEDIRKRFFDPNRLSTKDKKRLEFIKKKAATNVDASQSNLPPNFAEPGSKEMTIKNGQVIFGNDVVGNKDNCPDPLSKARAKAKLIENRIYATR